MILEYYPYMLGKVKSKALTKEPYRANDGDYEKALEIFNTKSKSAINNLNLTNTSRSFYKSEPDLAFYVEKEKRDEYFYMLKADMYSPLVPAKLLYVLKECFNQHGTYNMLTNFIPKRNVEEITSENYLADEKLSLIDVIHQGFDDKFVALSEENKIVKNEENFDIYIPCSDRVLIAPSKLAKELELLDLDKIKVIRKELTIDGKLLAELGNYLGVHRFDYDYRDLV